ncbi:MAG: nucleoside-diphosphate sugar epimerase/dehydratase [Pseudomonadota bacterium]
MTPRGEARRAMAYTLSFDAVMAFIAMGLALVVPWALSAGWPEDALSLAFNVCIIFTICGVAALVLLGVHKQVWRHSGWPDAFRLIQAGLLTLLVFLPIVFLLNRLNGVPRSALFLAVLFWLALMFSGRMIALSRSTNQPFQLFEPVRADAPAAVLIASQVEAAEVLRDLQTMEGGAAVRILGVIEAEGAEPGRAIRGVPVLGGLSDLPNVLDVLAVRYDRMPWVAVAGSLRKQLGQTEILAVASARKAEVMALGSDKEGLHLQPVKPADLLARPVRMLDARPVESALSGQHVFITGAGGTIGSELARQCLTYGANQMTLYEGSEFNLYSIELELHERAPAFSVIAQLGDVRDGTLLKATMETARPETVIHAAALKHVPLMEQNPCEAILTNVSGAMHAIDAAIAVGAKRFVFISTDKAVDPDNVMGATKRLAELVIAYRAQGQPISVSMVRFGNVLGSSGSVVPLFERQIRAGGPVTLTHEEVTRYFMTVEEAAGLVLQASAQTKTKGEADLYVLDMGQPIRIKSLAEAMIRMKGMVPELDIKIETTGLRPGEKLHEALTYPHERLDETGVEGLRVVVPEARRSEPEGFWKDLDALLTHARARDRNAALSALADLVPAYRLNGDSQDER